MRKICIFLLLASCQQHSQWQYQNIPTKDNVCTRLLYISEDPIQGIDVEFLCTGKKLSVYLQVHSHPIGHGENQQTMLRFYTEKSEVVSTVHLHAGKQRICLSQDLKLALINMLTENKAVTIELQGYREILIPNQFEKALKKLEKPSYKIPFHLPF